MNIKSLLLAGVALAFVVPSADLHAQVHGISLEVRGGWNFPMGEFSDAGAESEASFGGDVIVNVSRALSVYGGWGRDQFNCDGCGGSDDIHSSGLEGGLKVLFNRAEGGALPWARVGATYHKLAGEEVNSPFESDRSIGLQASVGVDFPLGDVLSVAPALRFQNTSVVFEGDSGRFLNDQNVRYVALDLGAHFHIR